jgi:hypothetical protein
MIDISGRGYAGGGFENVMMGDPMNGRVIGSIGWGLGSWINEASAAFAKVRFWSTCRKFVIIPT